jgi:hypothetical protein
MFDYSSPPAGTFITGAQKGNEVHFNRRLASITSSEIKLCGIFAHPERLHSLFFNPWGSNRNRFCGEFTGCWCLYFKVQVFRKFIFEDIHAMKRLCPSPGDGFKCPGSVTHAVPPAGLELVTAKTAKHDMKPIVSWTCTIYDSEVLLGETLNISKLGRSYKFNANCSWCLRTIGRLSEVLSRRQV